MKYFKSKTSFIFFAFFLFHTSLFGKLNLKLIPAFEVSFEKPIFMLPYPIRYPKLPQLYVVVEQEGVVKLVSKAGNTYSKKVANLLEIKKKVCSRGSEEGLLGFSFSPDFTRSKKAYIFYSVCSPRKTILSRIFFKPEFQKNPKKFTDLKFSAKEEILLKITQPYSNHNGGMIQFNLKDGFLYIGTGDGGSGGDPHKNGQKLNTYLGKILRIDVSPANGYKIPPDNPFRKLKGAKPEIFAYGLRNPWRFSFNKKGILIAGDVGQNKYEEIDIIRSGKNYGWNLMEGFHCYRNKNCIKKNLENPRIEYSHEEGQCVIGGYFYYGQKIPSLKGKYLFGDTTTGKVWYANLEGKSKNKIEKYLLFDTKYYISSFALDEEGEIYIINLLGQIYKITN